MDRDTGSPAERLLWGTATAAYQIEGSIGADATSESTWDRLAHGPGKPHDGTTGTWRAMTAGGGARTSGS